MKKTAKGGSFGIPEDMMDAIRKSKAQKQEASKTKKSEYTDAESIPEEFDSEEEVEEVLEKPAEEPPQKENKSTEQMTREEEDKLAKEIEEDLGISFDEDDMWKFWFQGGLEKKNVTIVPGVFVGTFQTISLEEDRKISENMALALEKKFLEDGFRNLRVQHILSFGLLELGKPGNTKSLGKNPEERFAAFGRMNSLMVEKLSQKWNKFVWLLDHTAKREMELKKS